MSFSVTAKSMVPALLPGFCRITVAGPKRSKGPVDVELIVNSAKGSRNLFGEIWFDLAKTNAQRGTSKCTARDLRFLSQEQGDKCNGCGRDLSVVKVEVDHYIPLVYGGPDEISNWQLLCRDCNRIKGDRSMAFLISILERRYPPDIDAAIAHLPARKTKVNVSTLSQRLPLLPW